MTNSHKVDYLIIGQGLAGTLIAHFLLKEKQNILVVDPDHQHSSSAIAAGIVNPITGYRFVKSWMLDDLLPIAASTYEEIEGLLGEKFFHQREILRVLFSAGEENDWLARTAQEGWSKYVKDEAEWGAYAQIANPGFSQGLLYGAQLDIGNLIKRYKLHLEENHLLLNQNVELDQLIIDKDKVTYQNIEAQNVIFCEGAKGAKNPWFSYLPFEIAKGEALIIRIKEIYAKRILKHKTIMAPLGDDLYWVGSNYEHHPKDDLPSEKGRKFILERLHKTLKVPFEEVQHLAAIRPATFDRRPFLGRHPEYSQLAIFNGLGAKGSSLAPYFAHQMVQHLLHQKPLHPEVDIKDRKKNKK